MSHSSTNYAHELTQAFEHFNQVSENLSASYQQLEEQVGSLTRRLAGDKASRAVEAEERIQTNHFHEQVLELLPGGVIVLDGDGHIQLCNGLALEYLGSPLLGELWRDVTVRAFKNTAQHDALQLQNGRLVEISTNPLGKIPGQVLLFRDVTASCAIQDLMHRHQRLVAMGEMVASLAHQIRTPIASSLLYLSHLRMNRVSESDRKRSIDKIHSCLDHLEGTVSDMLLYAKGGQMGSDIIPVTAMLSDLQLIMRPQLHASGCVLNIQDESNGGLIYGSRDALMSVLQNLMINAIQAITSAPSGALTPEGAGNVLEKAALSSEIHASNDCHGKLDLQVSSYDSKTGAEILRIVLKDNGPGIPQEIQEHIFEPFYTTKTHGTGLGLAVVRAIISAHDGAVWLKSEPGVGTSIGIELPIHDP